VDEYTKVPEVSGAGEWLATVLFQRGKGRYSDRIGAAASLRVEKGQSGQQGVAVVQNQDILIIDASID
jgi:hypothetical protein